MKDNSGKILLALMAGASAGVIAGLLMAPENGTTTRGNLKKQASKLTKDLEKTFQDGMKRMESMSGGLMNRKNGNDAGGTTNNAGGDANNKSGVESTTQQKGGVQGATASGGTGSSGASAGGSTPGV